MTQCSCCGKEVNRIVQDHDHFNGLDRGEICPSCNYVLTETLQLDLDKYVAYLNKWKVRHTEIECIPYLVKQHMHTRTYVNDDMLIQIHDYITNFDLSEVIPLDELLTRRFSA